MFSRDLQNYDSIVNYDTNRNPRISKVIPRRLRLTSTLKLFSPKDLDEKHKFPESKDFVEIT